jgi:hypothetical protein
MTEEFRNDRLLLTATDRGECVAPALLTISEAMIRVANGAAPLSGASKTGATPPSHRSLRAIGHNGQHI